MPKATNGKAATPGAVPAPEGDGGAQSAIEATEKRVTDGLMNLLGDQENPGTQEEGRPQRAAEQPTDNGQEPTEESEDEPADEAEGDATPENQDDEDQDQEADEDQADDGEEEDPDIPAETQARINSQMAKERRRRKAAEERAEAAEKRLKELEAGQPAPVPERVPGSALDQVLAQSDPSVAGLLKKVAGAEAARANARSFLRELNRPEDDQGRTGLDRVLGKLKERKIELERTDSDSVREWLEDQMDYAGQSIIEANQELVIKRARHTERERSQGSELERAAIAHYPWLSDEAMEKGATPEAKEAALMWKTGVFRNPGGRMILGDLVVGKLARERALKKPAANGARKAPALGGAPAATAPTERARASTAQSKMAKAKQSGSARDIEEALVAAL